MRNTGRHCHRLSCSLPGGLLVILFCATLAWGQPGSEEQARKHLVRGTAAIEMARSDDDLGIAAEEFKKAAEIAPTMAAAWYNLGAVQTKMGQFRGAIASFNRYLELAPRAEDAPRIRDEVTKLEFKLEQTEKFAALSGQWVMADGHLATVSASADKLVLVGDFRFPGEYDYNNSSVQHFDASPVYRQHKLELQQKGKPYIGLFVSDAWKPGLVCIVPQQTSEIAAYVEKDRIVLKLQRSKYQFYEDSDSPFSTEFFCKEMQQMGTIQVEIVLRQLPPGGILRGTAGLEANDEIISVNGTELAQLSGADRVMKMRGQPGQTAQLVVRRQTKEAGLFSKAEYGLFKLTVPYVRVQP